MKSLKTIQTLAKIGRILSKIAFIAAIIGFCSGLTLLSLSFSRGGSLIKIGGVTLHGLISNSAGYDRKSISAAAAGWLIICGGEAVVAKFAEIYFKNEQKAGTPFTFAGANELRRLGILTLAISAGCAVAGRVTTEILAGFLNIAEVDALDLYFNNGTSIALGVIFLLVSLLCRYGAELVQNERP